MATKYLQLNKPNAGSNNWGNAINQNFDKIDLEYGKINNNLASIESRMSDFGTFSFIQAIDENGIIEEVDRLLFCSGFILLEDGYYILPDDTPEYNADDNKWYYNKVDLSATNNNFIKDNNKVTVGSVILGHLIKNDNGTETFKTASNESGYSGRYYNDGDNESHIQFFNLPDFTAFYIQTPYILDGEEYKQGNVYAFGLEWTNGEILIKSSQIIDNVKQVKIQKLKQVLGGYYVPTIQDPNSPNIVTFIKQQGSEAAASVNVIIPHNTYNGVETITEINNVSGTTYTINTGILEKNTISDTEYTQRITNIKFFTGSSNNNRQYVYVDYKLSYSNGWQIIVDTTYLKTLFISYCVNQYVETLIS